MDPNDLEGLAKLFVDQRSQNPRSKITDKAKLASWFARQWSRGANLDDLDEARALASGTSSVKRAKFDSRQRDADRRRALEYPHAYKCQCDRTSLAQAACPRLPGAIERQISECTEADEEPKNPRIAALEAREWNSLDGWAQLVGGEIDSKVCDIRIKHPATFQRILTETEEEVKHGFSYYLESWGEVGMQNSVIVARLREVFERKIEIAYQRTV